MKKGGAASASSFDCKSDGTSSSESCALSVTADSDVYVQLIGYKPSIYTLTVSYQAQ